MQSNTITSPYNFVPMAENVFYPEWQQVSLDQPTRGGVAGEIQFTVKSQSPILVGGDSTESAQGRIVEFFKTPDGKYAIPGTSIKGMIRNWVEIATHSRMSIMNDYWLSFRDLRNPEYTSLLTEDLGNQTYKPKTQAGWLRFENGDWHLFPAQLWRVENSEIEDAFRVRIQGKESQDIYKKLKGIRGVNFHATGEKPQQHSGGRRLVYDKAENLSQADQSPKGYLIVTGQIPGPRNPKPGQSKGKHMNFIFSAPEDESMKMASSSVIKSFLDINIQRDDFSYLRGLKHQYGIPVFFIQENKAVKHIGLAQMFRFPYKYSVGQLRHESHLATSDKKDFTELLFGGIEEDLSRKGRLSFSLVKCQTENVRSLELQPTVLGSPRHSFYPAYIDQKNSKGKYNTYNQKEAKLSGFKRYGVHKSFTPSALQTPPSNKQGEVNYNVAVQLRPLPANVEFSGKVRFHNLNAIELGALVYALNLGGDDNDYFHSIGMGKSQGLGKIKFDDIKIALDNGEQSTDPSCYIDSFTDYAETSIKSDSTIMQLMMMQSESTFNQSDLKYLEFPNGFIDTVKTQGSRKLINLTDKASQRLESQKAQEKERKRKQKIQEEQKRKLAGLNQKSKAQELIEELGGEMSGKALKVLQDDVDLWIGFSESEKRELGHKICQGQFFKKKKTKGIRTKYPELLVLVELVNNKG